MATWLELAQENYQIAVTLEDGRYFRAACDRYYYSAFQVLMSELVSHGIKGPFGRQQNLLTPPHWEMPDLIRLHASRLSLNTRDKIEVALQNLRRRREIANYTLQTVDEVYARESHRYAELIFRYLGISR